MKRGVLLGIGASIVLCLFPAVFFAQGHDDVRNHPNCKYCGMNREQFAHSRALIEYEDGTTVGMCSIHCAAVELALQIDKIPKVILVGDHGSKSLIDAEKAFWVIGGSKMGVMTKRPKWAFEKKEDAERFIRENGGEISTFDAVIKAAYEDMYGDTKMIRERRKMKRMEHKKPS